MVALESQQSSKEFRTLGMDVVTKAKAAFGMDKRTRNTSPSMKMLVPLSTKRGCLQISFIIMELVKASWIFPSG